MSATVAGSAAPAVAAHRSGPWTPVVLLLAAALVIVFPGATSASTAPPGGGSARVLLSVTDPALAAATVADRVVAAGGRVEAVFDVAAALVAELPAGVAVPLGAVVVPDVALRVNAAPAALAPAVAGGTYASTVGRVPGYDGSGVTVALVDTGVADVADLAGRLRHVNVSGGPQGDGLGHGTFLAGLVAGDGSSSDGSYTGVAPGARVLDVQVATADGTTSLSRVLAGLQAVADARDDDASIAVLSLALSSGSPLPTAVDPLTRGLDRLWARGITVVVAAGNDGPDDGTVGSPGTDPTLITVGALDEHGTAARADDDVADFSSRGTVDGEAKPDLAAPGVSLVSTRAPGSIAETENPTSLVAGGYMHGSGTSMAQAVTAGAAAVLYDVRRSLTPATVKALLTSTAYPAAGLTRAAAGAGGLDLAAAAAAAPLAKVVRTPRDRVVVRQAAWGPKPSDAEAWAAFAAAWRAGDLEAVAAAWSRLSEQARRWSASAFAVALVTSGLEQDAADFAELVAAARRWSAEDWAARRWSDDAWVARRWSGQDWAARRWSLDEWAARRWSETSWDARRWSDEVWSARRWSDETWSARRWSGEDWLAFAWSARRWSSLDWADTAWATRDWTARRWSEASFEAWGWQARRWSSQAWDARRWSTESYGPVA